MDRAPTPDAPAVARFDEELQARGRSRPTLGSDGFPAADLWHARSGSSPVGPDGIEALYTATRRGHDIEIGAFQLSPSVGPDLTPAMELAARLGGGAVTWWARPADDDTDATAAAVRLVRSRDLLQLRRELPAPPPSPDLAVRPLVAGVDDARWLEVNNLAFAWHPEQSGMTQERLDARRREPWFDPAGFLVHDGPDGRIDGFCWTKLHTDHDPVQGEIFVIGVHPDAAGRGLGRNLTLAGLDHLSRRGAPSAMLYVESDNAAARRTYDAIGFDIDHTDAAYTGEIAVTLDRAPIGARSQPKPGRGLPD